jgi:NB-ARC domain
VPGDQPAPEPQLRQDIEAGHTAYTAGRDQFLTIWSSAMPPPQSAAPPRIWGDVPPRNPGFTGRDQLLGAVRSALVSGDRVVVQALRGMGGVGKTQLVIEYAHRYASDYDITWWIGAEQPELIVTQFAALGAALGCLQPGAEDTAVRHTVLSELSRRERWLLVFDNVVDPEHIMPWLPSGGSGHVLITSRTVVGWDDIAETVEIDVLERGESVLMLRRRVQGLEEADASQVAAAVADLPLAVAQAAAYLARTGRPAAEYVTMVEERAADILNEGRPPSYPLPLAAVTILSLDRLEADSPAAAQAVRLCAFLAPESVPAEWFADAAGQLPGPLKSAAADPLAWGRVLARISEQALARIGPQGLLMHRLTQAVIRTRMTPREAAQSWNAAAILLTANRPAERGYVRPPEAGSR